MLLIEEAEINPSRLTDRFRLPKNGTSKPVRAGSGESMQKTPHNQTWNLTTVFFSVFAALKNETIVGHFKASPGRKQELLSIKDETAAISRVLFIWIGKRHSAASHIYSTNLCLETLGFRNGCHILAQVECTESLPAILGKHQNLRWAHFDQVLFYS